MKRFPELVSITVRPQTSEERDLFAHLIRATFIDSRPKDFPAMTISPRAAALASSPDATVSSGTGRYPGAVTESAVTDGTGPLPTSGGAIPSRLSPPGVAPSVPAPLRAS